jgi:hypothetical protein
MCLDDKEVMKNLREEALNQIALKQKQQAESSSSLLNTNKRESVREQMKVYSFRFYPKKEKIFLSYRLKKMIVIE